MNDEVDLTLGENEESLDKNFRDSILRGSMNASNLTDIARASVSNIAENDTVSMLARRASNSIAQEINVLKNQGVDKENQCRNSQNASVVPGFTTLDEKSKYTHFMHQFNQNKNSDINLVNSVTPELTKAKSFGLMSQNNLAGFKSSNNVRFSITYNL